MIAKYRESHPFDRFGPANQVTAVRALLVGVLAASLFRPHSVATVWFAILVAAAAALLDGVDGWIARRTRMASAFGARFDMEVDAALILVLAVLAFTNAKAGAWILAAGLMRYAFVAAGRIWSWMRRPLPATLRGKTICVVQIVGLIVSIVPAIKPPLSSAIAALTLAALSWSFLVDITWLWERRLDGFIDTRWRRWAALILAAAVLNASLTFDNIWPTPAFWWTGRVSIEFAAWLFLVATLRHIRGPMGTRALGVVSGLWLLLTLARYAEVTAPALYGRDINLYWDLRFIPDVAAMVVRVAPVWLMALSAAIVVLVIGAIHRLLLWALQRVDEGGADPQTRRAYAVWAFLVVALFAAERISSRPPNHRFAPEPVIHTYARQVALVLEARSGSTSIPESPPIESTFDAIRGADVFLVFVESYGAVADEPAFALRLEPARQRLEADIRASNRAAVSAYVESPTFGGSSWLAHLSLISGVEVRDSDTNALLMTQPRDTLVKAFRRGGYRTIALMPGLRQQWPEGRFYGFDDIYGADRLGYSGPEFGWFAIPDQFSLAKFDVLERARPEAPRFVFYPTISTHFPFSPTPPYQPDWTRMLSPRPYDGPEIVRAYARQPDWTNFAPGYVDALSYDFAVVGGYLRQHADRDIVMILIGDHQPPAAVSGEHATWNVPVHVIASRSALMGRLRAAGFGAGLEPERRAVARMHGLLPILLDAFGA